MNGERQLLNLFVYFAIQYERRYVFCLISHFVCVYFIDKHQHQQLYNKNNDKFMPPVFQTVFTASKRNKFFWMPRSPPRRPRHQKKRVALRSSGEMLRKIDVCTIIYKIANKMVMVLKKKSCGG